jgi:hypothetical protein
MLFYFCFVKKKERKAKEQADVSLVRLFFPVECGRLTPSHFLCDVMCDRKRSLKERQKLKLKSWWVSARCFS